MNNEKENQDREEKGTFKPALFSCPIDYSFESGALAITNCSLVT
jgi:hypothetical protein